MMRTIPAAALILLAACSGGDHAGVPGDAADSQPYAGIGADEVVHVTGTEPFWGGEVKGGVLAWSTPEKPQGTPIPVQRFAGRGGIGYTGTLDGRSFAVTLTEGECSDGMSDRTYPFTASVAIGQDPLLSGCGWSDSRPYSGGE